MKHVTVRRSKDLRQREEYVVQGTDGWKLVTNDPAIAAEESRKQVRNYGENRIHY